MAPKTTQRPARKAFNGEAASASNRGEFSLGKALFEIAIVAIGVLLALGVDEIRQTHADRDLVGEAKEAMHGEVEQNRIRLVTKLARVHEAYRALSANPAVGPALVEQRTNLQIELADAAWTMAQETDALRLMDTNERQTFATIYASHAIYNRILAEEMNHWVELAAPTPNDRAVAVWRAYARRIAGGACISLMRIERFRGPQVPTSQLQQACGRYNPAMPPEILYRMFRLDMPRTHWEPGSDF